MPFQKGQSGNPGGRKAVAPEVRELALQNGPAAMGRVVELSQSKDERVALAACEVILERAYGKAIQAIIGDFTLEHIVLESAASLTPLLTSTMERRTELIAAPVH